MPKVNKVGSSRALSKTAGFSSVPKANAVENGRQDVSNPPRSSVAEHPPSDDDADADADAKAVVGGEKTSRGQQKRQARREQFLKKLTLINGSLNLGGGPSSAPLRKAPAPQPAVSAMGDLMDALESDDVDAKALSAEKAKAALVRAQVTSNRAKKAVALQELEHFKLVLQHPVFVSNPFEAMQQHLNNTLAPVADNSGAGRGKAGAAGGNVKKAEAKQEYKRNGSSHRKRR